jgi:hypothetical protein
MVNFWEIVMDIFPISVNGAVTYVVWKHYKAFEAASTSSACPATETFGQT